MKPLLLFALLIMLHSTLHAQTADSALFSRIQERLESFVPDTADVPEDSVTYRIKVLRSLKGGFNIQDAMAYKLKEAVSKKEMPDPTYQELSAYLNNGDGKRLLDNAITAIYREHFSYAELGQLIVFYKTSAGRKMAEEFPLIMIESVKSAEMIMKAYGPKE